ncbi:hypothetical protein SBA4_400021 [Candidatus Sulfopaludibacter sp. SbA4]|nr:hypothetical protein SBA4_400021 [Candidatus Sulfopaludibacter sp. SbA4]
MGALHGVKSLKNGSLIRPETASVRCSAVLMISAWIAYLGNFQSLFGQPRSASVESIRRSLAAVADALPTFETWDLIYNRSSFLPHSLQGLIEANYDADRLTDALADERPRIRTLALALLFSKEDPKLLEHIARHLGDTAASFPVLLPTANADPTRTAPQTVSDVAKALLGAYLLAAGINEWRDPSFHDWSVYDANHRNRQYCLSWLIVRLSRITEMQSPFREERRPIVLKFRRDMEKLPSADRDLYLLWLCHGNTDFDGGRVLATEGELLEAAKRLGRQTLLQIVDGRAPGTDPDLVTALDRHRAVVYFLLTHADRLFTQADEPFLAAIEQGQRDKIARGANPALELVSIEALRRARAMLLADKR